MADDKNKTMWIVVVVIAAIIGAFIILYMRRAKAENGNGNGNGDPPVPDPENYMKITIYTHNPSLFVCSFYDQIHRGRVSKYVEITAMMGFLAQWLAEARINQIQYDTGVAQYMELI